MTHSADQAGIPALLGQGYALLRAGRFAPALAHALRSCAEHPHEPQLYELAAEARLALGEPEAALAQIVTAAAKASRPLPLLIKQADLLIRLRRRADAMRLLDRLETLAGDHGQVWQRLATLRRGSHDIVGAQRCYQRARQYLGDQPALLYDLAAMQFFSGDFAQAETSLDQLLKLRPQAADACYLRATLRRQQPQRNHIAQLRATLAAGLADDAGRAACLYALAKELEDVGQHQASFEALNAAARYKRASLNYDVAAECATIAALRQAYGADEVAALLAAADTRDQTLGEGVIFIVGMPRTGTTLLERLLRERGGAHSAGELSDFALLLAQASAQLRQQTAAAGEPDISLVSVSRRLDFAALGREYLRGAREAAGGHPVFIDKMPVNYLYCPMLAAALPGARIVHLRRDPFDTCYAVYKTLFYQAYPFSYDLQELAEYYLAYRATMQHWQAVMPGRILDVDYEHLVGAPEQTLQQVLSWCGLNDLGGSDRTQPSAAMGAVVTASAAQVRGEIHTRSVHASRRHLGSMTPLLERLLAAGIERPD